MVVEVFAPTIGIYLDKFKSNDWFWPVPLVINVVGTTPFHLVIHSKSTTLGLLVIALPLICNALASAVAAFTVISASRVACRFFSSICLVTSFNVKTYCSANFFSLIAFS
mgnify:CR=1 FL=1